MNYGYRWVKSEQGKTYIVKLCIDGEYWHDPKDKEMLNYITESCSIVSIEDCETGELVDDIGQANAYFKSNVRYRVGNTIDGQKTWFCLTKAALCQSQLCLNDYAIRLRQLPTDRGI